MPDFLPPEAVRFELVDGSPVLRLAVEAPGPAQDDQWLLVNRLTLCVVDGPGEAGYLVARLGPGGADAAPPGWDDAVDRAAGTTVVFGAEPHSPSIFARALTD
ncbi:hypothetical protein ACQEVC_08255 [Plantactinospora sp. CA-294935]|uniref:hypothetical protein n=1 Tax=Plantactinospora sp. CA-294935 TaxID=3240012 RepID=UPI003D93E7C8